MGSSGNLELCTDDWHDTPSTVGQPSQESVDSDELAKRYAALIDRRGFGDWEIIRDGMRDALASASERGKELERQLAEAREEAASWRRTAERLEREKQAYEDLR